MPNVYFAGLFAVLIVLGLGGSYIKGRSDGGAIVRSEYSERYLKAATDYAAKEREIVDANRKKEARWQEKFVSASRTYQKGLASAHTQRLADIAAIDAGTLRLRDPGTDSQACGSPTAVAASGSSGHSDKKGTELSPEFTKFLLSEATRADQYTIQLNTCIDILNNERQ